MAEIRGEELYGYRKRLADALVNIEKAKDITPRNKEAIRRFADHCTAEGLSLPRSIKYVYTLRTLAQLLEKDFDGADKADIEGRMSAIERHPKGYSAWTKKDFRVCTKKFYKWLRDTGDDFPPEVAWIKTSIRRDRKKMPDELLTEEDVKKLVDAASTSRDKALIFTLYESGARIGELAAARIKHFSPGERCSSLILIGKTGMRRVIIHYADPYIRRWLNEHPRGDDPNAPLWTKSNGKPLSYPTVAGLIRRITLRSGIKKNVHAHLFRHSRATFLAKFLTEAQMSMYFGWQMGTKMTAVYVHMAGRDVDDTIMGIYGIKPPPEEENGGTSPLDSSRVCPRCEERNPGDARFCFRCGLALEMKAAFESEQDLKKLEAIFKLVRENPQLQDLLEGAARKDAVLPAAREREMVDEVLGHGQVPDEGEA